MWRPGYNLVIKQIEDSPAKAVKWMLTALESRKINEVDSCINYVITQIIRNKHFITENEGVFIRSIIIEVYKSPFSYFHINRFNGLITSIIDELEERDWDTAKNISFLIKLRLLYKQTFTKDYEKKKLEENGDLERIV